MPAGFVLTTFIRQVPVRFLQGYFHHRELLSEFDFSSIKRNSIEGLLLQIQGLLKDPRSPVEVDFRRINGLANKTGTRIMLEEVPTQALKDHLSELENHYARAMWLFLNPLHLGANLFDRCAGLGEIHGRTYPRSRQLRNLPRGKPLHSPAVLRAMGDAIIQFYSRQCRGYNCKSDYFERSDPERDYYVFWPQDYSSSLMEYQKGELVREDHSTAFQIICIFYPTKGLLEVWVPGPLNEVKAVQEIFCRLALQLAGVPRQASSTSFDLDRLRRDLLDFPTNPADGLHQVTITAVRIEFIDFPDESITLVRGRNDERSVRQWLEDRLNLRHVDQDRIIIVEATFQTVWRSDGLRQRPTHRFIVFTEGEPTLPDDSWGYTMREYLRKWNLEK